MNYARYLTKAGFAYGFGKGIGVMIGLATGTGIVIATGALIFGGAMALKEYKKKKSERESE